ncbi:uncharacterized protein LOC110452615 [Mizuhopecten yessoensis]|nr:uncharacterized protein LOC110452615 [Mizuhopecten yessoensis]
MTQARHAKRIVPESLKDETYWEKRKKNNIAAKRSRESRRRVESDIRIKIDILEKENMLLKKEMSLLKSKYGIPAEHSMLTHQERLDCLHEFDESRTSSGRAEKFGESLDDSQSKMSRKEEPIMTKYESRGTNISRQSSDHEDEKSSSVCSEYGHPMAYNNSFDGIVWSTGAEQQTHMEQNGSDRRFTIEGLNLNPYGQIGHFPYHYVSYQMGHKGHEGHEQGFFMGANRKQTHISANLSMTKSDDLRHGNTSVQIQSLRRASPNTSMENGQVCPMSASCESTSSERNVACTNKLDKVELRRKIMQLSAQCEEMKDFVFKA